MRLSPEDVASAKRQLLKMHYCNRVGHLGGNLSALDAMMLLYHELMGKHDRFILSKGHSAGAYYITLWSLGLITETELTTFHQDGTRLSGHPPDPVLDRQPGAWSFSCCRSGAGGAVEGRNAPRLLPDLRWRMAGGLDAGGADFCLPSKPLEFDDPGRSQRLAGVWHHRRGRFDGSFDC
jgi:hypothetical protein